MTGSFRCLRDHHAADGTLVNVCTVGFGDARMLRRLHGNGVAPGPVERP
ncbi:hypothetical protein [Actinomadura vinacea]